MVSRWPRRRWQSAADHGELLPEIGLLVATTAAGQTQVRALGLAATTPRHMHGRQSCDQSIERHRNAPERV